MNESGRERKRERERESEGEKERERERERGREGGMERVSVTEGGREEIINILCYHGENYYSSLLYTVWVTKSTSFFVKQRSCNGSFAFVSVPVPFYIFPCLFLLHGQNILRKWNGEKTVKRTLYVHI